MRQISRRLEITCCDFKQHPQKSPFIVRQAKQQDVHQCAVICQEAFSSKETKSSPLVSHPRTLEAWETQIDAALAMKARARKESRNFRLLQKHDNEPELEFDTSINKPSPAEYKKLQLVRWNRQRTFCCIVAADSSTVVACCALSLAQPEARLPAPFPTSAPIRVVISNLAVSQQHQQQGIGTKMIGYCERLARLWGYDSVWMHVDNDNKASIRLYERLGYVAVGGMYFGFQRRKLLRKSLPPLPIRRANEELVTDDDRMKENKDGVFVWKVSNSPSSITTAAAAAPQEKEEER